VEREPPEAGAGPPTPVLLAEDDPLMREFLAAVLASLGYAVTVAGDGRAALDILERAPINLVLTDWMCRRSSAPATASRRATWRCASRPASAAPRAAAPWPPEPVPARRAVGL
jgi:CheY-like chemotaxis protein